MNRPREHESVTRVSRLLSRPSHVWERLISALIPDALGPRTDDARAPMAVLPALSRLGIVPPVSLLVSTSRMDRSGRIHERLLLRELGSEPGDRVNVDTMHGVVLIAATPSGLVPADNPIHAG
jgi:hypothetical protein